MSEHSLVGLAWIVILGIGAQWLAWRMRLPSILFLLIFGFIAGPLTGFLDPDRLVGDLLLPIVSLSVGIILFEGGLSLRVSELREIGTLVRNLITIGVLATWLMGAGAAHLLLHLNVKLSILLGAILVVTGPTVVGPLLRHIRPVGRVGSVLKWEGILIDPVGALLAALVFQAILVSEFEDVSTLILIGVAKSVFVSGFVGLMMAGCVVFLLQRHWIPDFLHETVTLMFVVTALAISNTIQQESGLIAATVMGVALANQRKVAVKHIVEFKENLRILIVSSVFILLASRIRMSHLEFVNMDSLAFSGALILLVRPASVALSTLRSDFTWRERVFMSWMAPRGIVAAALGSISALRLSERGCAQTEYLVPLTFLVIIGTVVTYGLTAPPLARWLGLAESHPQGALIIGAHNWGRALARALHAEGFAVLLVDTNRANIRAALREGLPAFHGNILSESTMDEIELHGIGRALAITANDEANSLAALHLSETFGLSEVYQLAPESEPTEAGQRLPRHLRGRFLFGREMNYAHLSRKFAAGAQIKTIDVREASNFETFTAHHDESTVPLFLITRNGRLKIFTVDTIHTAQPGESIVAVVDLVRDKNSA